LVIKEQKLSSFQIDTREVLSKKGSSGGCMSHYAASNVSDPRPEVRAKYTA